MTDQQHAPLAPARHAHILAALQRDGIVRVSQLTEELGVAPVTLRRDLQQLEEDGRLERVHGGAVSVS
ncbi:MAG TPA: DeoR family transcriptional regulator, partial [Microbacterium sp.]|nr:DeoR family transcriptional regulator [Microbacterium sp.]